MGQIDGLGEAAVMMQKGVMEGRVELASQVQCARQEDWAGQAEEQVWRREQ